jgi:hypothetical protein
MSVPFRRRVHFISGFDPRGPVHYHRLYREEAEKQSRLNGSKLSVGPRKRLASGAHQWIIEGEWTGSQTVTDYRFMAWDDVIRSHWVQSRPLSYACYLRDISHYVFCGAFAKLARTGRGPLYASLLPLAISVGPLLVAGLIALTGGVMPGLVALVLAALATWELSRRINLVWLTNIYAFCCAWGRKPLPDLEARMDAMAAQIADAEGAEPCDEILLIGHSVGALLAVSVMARLLEKGTRVELVTIGACAPMLGLMPAAAPFRENMQCLAESPGLRWRDYASLSDILSFGRVDPLAVCGINRLHPEEQTRELVKIVHMFSPENYARLRRDKLRLHFQYLMAADIGTDYDYFRMTAGPKAVPRVDSRREPAKPRAMLSKTKTKPV